MATLTANIKRQTTKSLRFTLAFGLLAISAVSAHASTIYGGFEDTKGGDYDYNDLVFSLTANSLVLHSNGTYFSEPTLKGTGQTGQGGKPFWNNVSSDGANYNVGYCIYGGGNCNSGTGLSPMAKYLAANDLTTTGSANDVTFSVDGRVSTTVSLTITSATDFLGWYNTSTPSIVTFFSNSGNSTGTYSFNPNGNFGLVGRTGSNPGTSYYSNTSVSLNTADNVSHFAFFSNAVATPEPGTWALFGSALAGITVLRRRLTSKRKDIV